MGMTSFYQLKEEYRSSPNIGTIFLNVRDGH